MESPFIQFVAPIMWSHLTNMFYRAGLSNISDLGQTVPMFAEMERIHENRCAFHTSICHKEGELSSKARRDETQFVGDFEHF